MFATLRRTLSLRAAIISSAVRMRAGSSSGKCVGFESGSEHDAGGRVAFTGEMDS